MSQADAARRTRRLNLRALAALAAAALVAAPALWAVKALQDRNGKSALLAEARARLKEGQPGPALTYLGRYLELNPGDPDALNLKAKVLADGARDAAQAQEAAQAYNQVLGRSPEGPRRQEARRQLARLNFKMGRPQAAEVQARALLAAGARDAEAHRLLARARQWAGLAGNDPAAVAEARKEYEAAEAIEPGDVPGGERLAALYRESLGRPDEAKAVLDRLADGTAGDPKKHAAALLARARHHLAMRQAAKDEAGQKRHLAAAEADALRATRDDPTDVEVRLLAAEVALQSHDPKAARHHVAEAAGSARDDLRIKLYEGIIDLYDRKPDEAIRGWRAGLLQAGGNSDDLTWRLANVLLETNRPAEAQPLIEQYHRLIGENAALLPRYHYLNGLALLKSNRAAEAVAELEPVRYKIEKPLEPSVYFTLGTAYEMTRDESRAKDAYRRAAEGSADWNGPWVALARLQAASRPDEAAATLRRGLTLGRGDDPGMLAELARCLFLAELQKADPAKRSWAGVEKVLADARGRAPGSPDLARVEAEFYAATGRPDDAVALLATATGLNPKSPEVWLARAGMLARLRRVGEALGVLDQAERAAGPQAAFCVYRASMLITKGRYQDARRALTDGLDRVPPAQRPLLWKNMGEFYRNPGVADPAAARAAYEQWARLQPANPEPRVALFDLAVASGDDRAVAGALAGVKEVAGPKGGAWRHARFEDLLRDRPGEAPEAARDADRLAEAEALALGVKRDDPRSPLGDLMEGRVRERQKRTGEAAEAYARALDRNEWGALEPLLALYIRGGRMAEVDALRVKLKASPTLPLSLAFDRVAAGLAIKEGETGRAEELARQAVRGNPDALDTRVWEADVLRTLGKPKEAEAALRALTREKPAEAAPWLQLLMLLVSQGKKGEAAAAVEDIRRHVTREEDRPELLAAQCYRIVGDAARARGCFAEAQRRWPNDPTVRAAAVSFFEQMGLRDEAEAELRALRKVDAAGAWATRKLAVILASKPGDRAAWSEALALVGPEARPDDLPDDLVARANVYSLSPDPADRARAVAILESLLKDQPGQPRLHDQLARLLSAAGEKDRACAHAAKAASPDGAVPDAVLFYAALLVEKGDATAADDQLDRLKPADAGSLAAVEVRARVLAARGRADEAAKLLEDAFAERASAPDAVGIGEKVVLLLTSLGRYDAADRVAERVAGLGPKGRRVRAEYLAGRGRVGEAASLLDEAARGGDPAAVSTALNLAARPGADPKWAGLADRLLAADRDAPPSFDRLQKVALLRHFQGRYAEEVETYHAMLALNPPNYMFLNNMAWTLSEDMGRPEDGLRRADEALKRAGELPHVLDTRGVILTRLGRFDEAAESLAKAARALNDPAVDFHLARAYRKAGKADESRGCRDRALRRGLTPAHLQPSERSAWDEVMNP